MGAGRAEHLRLVAASPDSAVLEPSTPVIETTDTGGDPVLVSASGSRIVVVGTFGASIDEMDSVLAVQLVS